MDQQVIPKLSEGKFATWRVNLASYFIYLHENILLLVEYGVRDEFDDMTKEAILHSISNYDSMHVRHFESAKEMFDKL